MGNTMTKAIYDKFKSATHMGSKVATGAIPTEALDITVSVSGFKSETKTTQSILRSRFK